MAITFKDKRAHIVITLRSLSGTDEFKLALEDEMSMRGMDAGLSMLSIEGKITQPAGQLQGPIGGILLFFKYGPVHKYGEGGRRYAEGVTPKTITDSRFDNRCSRRAIFWAPYMDSPQRPRGPTRQSQLE